MLFECVLSPETRVSNFRMGCTLDLVDLVDLVDLPDLVDPVGLGGRGGTPPPLALRARASPDLILSIFIKMRYRRLGLWKNSGPPNWAWGRNCPKIRKMTKRDLQNRKKPLRFSLKVNEGITMS